MSDPASGSSEGPDVPKLSTGEQRAEQMRLANKAKLEKAETDANMLNGANLADTAAMRAELAANGEPMSSKEEQMQLSAKFNERLEYMFPGHERSRSWLSLFKAMDDDGSGLVTFTDLQNVLRKQMKVPVTDLPEARLQALWCTLDEDDSNYVAQAEFGKFMLLAGPSHSIVGKAEQTSEQVKQQNIEKLKKAEQEAAEMAGADLTNTAAMRKELAALDMEPSSLEEQKALSLKFNERLEYMFPGKDRNRSWLALFKAVDDDNSGLINYDELQGMVRKQMKISTAELPVANLKALWCALDTDDSNNVGHTEFGKLMTLAIPAEVVAGVAARRAEELRQEHLAAAAAEKAAASMLTGADLTDTAAMRTELDGLGIPAADVEAQTEIALRFNDQLEYLFPGKDRNRSWLQFFRAVDEDNSGLIVFDELIVMVRKRMKIAAVDLPDNTLKALWISLDVDNSNNVAQSEFGRFMLLGGPSHSMTGVGEQHAEERRQAVLKKAAEMEEAAKRLVGANLTDTAAMRSELAAQGSPPVTDEEQMAMSTTFNRVLEYMYPGKGRSWTQLFAAVDDDGSGQVTYAELEHAVRKDMKISDGDLSDDRLKALWCLLDADDSNMLNTVEFGKFMMLAGPARTAKGTAEKHAEEMAKQAQAKLAKERREANLLNGANLVDTAAMRSELAALGIQPASQKDQEAMALQFNKQLEYLYPGSDRNRTWLQFFRAVDEDGSGLISFDEIVDMTREQMKMTEAELPDTALKALWCSMDSDDSNTVAQAEFGRLMKLANPAEVVAGVQDRRGRELIAANKAKAAADAAEAKRRSGYVMTTKEMSEQLTNLGIPPANETEQREISVKFNARLDYIVPGKGATRTWLTLFKAVDIDGSGCITYDELHGMVRQKLKLTKPDLPDIQIMALWVALDADASNQISSAEFGRFMRLTQQKRTAISSSRDDRKIPLAKLSPKAKPLPPPPGSNRPSGVFARNMAEARGANPPPPQESESIFSWPSRKYERPISPPGSSTRSGSAAPRTLHTVSPPARPLSALDEQYRQLVASQRREASSGRRAHRPMTARTPRSAQLEGLLSPRHKVVHYRPSSSPQPMGPYDRNIGPYSRGWSRPRSPPAAMSSPRPRTGQGPGRSTRASYGASIWAMRDASPPRFAAVGPVERDYMHGIDMYRRLCDRAIQRAEDLGSPVVGEHVYDGSKEMVFPGQAKEFGRYMKLTAPPHRMTGKGERRDW